MKLRPAYGITLIYREAYGLYTCSGIAFNHESPLRGETFVTRKITRAMARIALGLQDRLYLGNISALRDWGHAKDYVEMPWLMQQQERPEDFVITTGMQYSVRQFVEFAAAELGITLSFTGIDAGEVGTVTRVVGDRARCKVGDVIVRVDPRYYRPTEVETLLGDPTKAKEKLGWVPCKKWCRATTRRLSATASSSSLAFRLLTITNRRRRPWVPHRPLSSYQRDMHRLVICFGVRSNHVAPECVDGNGNGVSAGALSTPDRPAC